MAIFFFRGGRVSFSPFVFDLPFFKERDGLPDKLGLGGLAGEGGAVGAVVSIIGGEGASLGGAGGTSSAIAAGASSSIVKSGEGGAVGTSSWIPSRGVGAGGGGGRSSAGSPTSPNEGGESSELGSGSSSTGAASGRGGRLLSSTGKNSSLGGGGRIPVSSSIEEVSSPNDGGEEALKVVPEFQLPNQEVVEMGQALKCLHRKRVGGRSRVGVSEFSSSIGVSVDSETGGKVGDSSISFSMGGKDERDGSSAGVGS